MLKPHRLNRKRLAGFGLVEIMVAMVIGMFGVLIMMQVLSTSEAQKRTTISGNDAMNEGVIALYAIQADVRMGGVGLTDPKLLGCSVQLRAGVTMPAAAPVTINPANITGQDANTDALLAFYSNSAGTPQGDKVIGAGNIMQTPTAFAVGDWVLNVPDIRPSPCNLVLDRVANVDIPTGVLTVSSGSALPKDDRVFNLGQTYRAIGYAIRGGNLTQCDFSNAGTDCSVAGNWSSIANNIVSLRAQYGRDTSAAMDGVIDSFDQVTPDPALTVNTMCNWARISALRLALVARSAQMEKLAITGVAGGAPTPVWDGSVAGNPTGSVATPIDLTGGANWQNYRYKTFQSVVPLRNISWLGAISGC